MILHVNCAMCEHEAEYKLDTQQVMAETTLGEILRARGWILQQNGDHFDIYCSKRCAA